VDVPEEPVGMPDPDRHRICRRCGKWFERDQGELVGPEGRFEQGYLLGTGDVLRFQCARCTRVRRRTRAAIWGIFFWLLALVWLLVSLGVIE
jgi:hypothetical protein